MFFEDDDHSELMKSHLEFTTDKNHNRRGVKMKGSIRQQLISVLSIVFICGVSHAWGATTLSDTAFDTADWSTTVIKANNNSSEGVLQETTGGNPGAFRKMDHTMPGGRSDTFLWVFPLYRTKNQNSGYS